MWSDDFLTPGNLGHLFTVTLFGWKGGVFWKSRAPPTHNIIMISWYEKVGLVLRFHNRAPLRGAISNLEEVIAKKPKKSRLFSTIFGPKSAKSLRRFVNFDQLLKVAAKWQLYQNIAKELTIKEWGAQMTVAFTQLSQEVKEGPRPQKWGLCTCRS